VFAASGLVGLLWLRDAPAGAEDEGPDLRLPIPRPVAAVCLVLWGGLLLGLPLLAASGGAVRLFGVFFQAGALVFGGGHVVLPLLEAQVVPTGLVGHDVFLAGYGAAQAAPGPLFTFAAFLGASSTGTPSGLPGAAFALVGVFLPGALLLVGALPFWAAVRRARRARRVLAGVNAGVVGLLAAALHDPVFTAGVTSPVALAVAIGAFVALTRWSAPPWAVVVAAAALGALLL
jgi:chromate transporter